ncbi:MAG TPA: NAD-dependent epimerase/dehydratase family protein [Rhodanobacteraceae bacterium]|nr:NAD-dependent epimerase/dehydratase family protein [Rhodanobacteraceae bacterium]
MSLPEAMRGAGVRGGQVLITGGAGFVGSHLADELLEHGYRVRALDNLDAQVHGETAARPAYLNPEVELVRGDVRDRAAVNRALRGVDAVFHFAAAVGVGQSMYEIERYTDVNNRGTAVLLEALSAAPPQRLIVASSMSVYGEGRCQDAEGRIVDPPERAPERLRAGDFELRDEDGTALAPLPTPEDKQPAPSSVYALSKLDQEKLSLIIGDAYGVPTVALRFFNIYGTRQALSNPYTGVLAIFAARYLNHRAPMIFEDGLQRRDFVNVRDVARACRLALQADHIGGSVINVGSGRSISILGVAAAMAQALAIEDLPPQVTRKVRVGDIRHCFADITRAATLIGYTPQVSLTDGLRELVDWMTGERALDRVDAATEELSKRGLRL